MTEQRYRLLVLIALILAAVKFLLVPWIEKQGEAAEQLSVLTRRLDRSEGVIQNRVAIERSRQEVEATISDARKRFPDAADASAFRLDAQQKITAVGTQTGLSLKIFEWILDEQVPEARLGYSRARIQFEGGFMNLVKAQTTLEADFPNMVIREFIFNAATPIGSANQSLASLTVVADFHFRPTAVAAKAGPQP